MKTIWKFELRITDLQTLALPADAQILTAQVQGDNADAVMLWAIVDPDRALEQRTFIIRGTGRAFSDDHIGKYITTFQLHGGLFIGHLFEVTP